MDLLFIIFIAVVAAGFAIILCVGCYCSCCHPVASYSSSSSYHRERSHGEYKSDGTTKSSKSFEYDKHQWDNNRSKSTSPLISEHHHSTSSLTQYPTRPSPIGFEHVAKSQDKQTVSTTGDTSAGTPPYPVNQKIVNEKSHHTTITTYPTQTDSTYPSNQQSHHTIDSPYPLNQQSHKNIVTSYQSPQAATYSSNQQSYQTVVKSSPSQAAAYPNNQQNRSTDLETTTISHFTPIALHSVDPADARVANQTIHYTKSADPRTQSNVAQPSDSRITTQTTYYTKTGEPHPAPMVQSNLIDPSDCRRVATQTTYYTKTGEPRPAPVVQSNAVDPLDSRRVTTQTTYYTKTGEPHPAPMVQSNVIDPSDTRRITTQTAYYTKTGEPHPTPLVQSNVVDPSDTRRVTTQTTYYTKTDEPYNVVHPSDSSSKVTAQTTYYTRSDDPHLHTQTSSVHPSNSTKNIIYYTKEADSHPHAQIGSAHPSDSKLTSQTTYYKTVEPHSNPMVHSTQVIRTYPANVSSKPVLPMETSSSTKTTYVVESQKIPSNNNAIFINKNVYSDNQQMPSTYPDVVNESRKSGTYITRHPSTGSLYDNM